MQGSKAGTVLIDTAGILFALTLCACTNTSTVESLHIHENVPLIDLSGSDLHCLKDWAFASPDVVSGRTLVALQCHMSAVLGSPDKYDEKPWYYYKDKGQTLPDPNWRSTNGLYLGRIEEPQTEAYGSAREEALKALLALRLTIDGEELALSSAAVLDAPYMYAFIVVKTGGHELLFTNNGGEHSILFQAPAGQGFVQSPRHRTRVKDIGLGIAVHFWPDSDNNIDIWQEYECRRWNHFAFSPGFACGYASFK